MKQGAVHLPADKLREMVQKMVSLGPRLTGSPAHNSFIDYLEAKMSALGLEIIRDAYTFKRWQARSWSLAVDDGSGETPINLASYFPYSGSTLSEGIEADLVSLDLPMENRRLFRDLPTFVRQTLRRKWRKTVRAAWRAQRGDVEGAIVLVYGPSVPVTTRVFLPFLTYAKDDDLDRLDSSDFKRAWLGGLLFGVVVDFLLEAGAKGAIFHLDASPQNAKGQYVPFSSPIRGLPAVLVDRVVAKELRDLAARRRPNAPKARLKLVADTFPNTRTDNLIAILPGANYKSRHDECMIVNTHTDGQNAFEENGGIACLAIAQHYAAIPQAKRPRTLVFSLVSGHMGPNLPQTQGFIDRFPYLIRKAACAITIEHLGATEWLDDAQGYHATGRSEFAAAFQSETLISKIARESYEASPLTGVNLLRPIFDTPVARILARENYLTRTLRRIFDTRWLPAYFGVGAPLHQAGVPSIGYLTGPNYLVTISKDGEMSKFDQDRMRGETEWVIDTLHRLETVPRRKLRRSQSIRHLLGLILGGIALLFAFPYLTMGAIELAGTDPGHPLWFLCIALVLACAVGLAVYTAVRATGWWAIYRITTELWRKRIQRQRYPLYRTR